jgi:hypothetical protein
VNGKKYGLSEKADAAFQATTVAVIQRALQTRTPVVVWENGQVKEISSEQLEQSAGQPSADESPS